MTKDKLKKHEIGIVKKQGILENQANIVFLGIGSNLGNRKHNIEKAKFLLQLNNINIINSSSFYETNSWPNKNFPKYLNIVVKAKTSLDPSSLFINIKYIEAKLGRKKIKRNHPRICDIDIIDYNNKKIVVNTDRINLKIPHPRAHKTSIVLVPLHEISKNWIHPIFKQKIGYLLLNIHGNGLRTIKFV